jgi:thiol peroxidase
MAQTAFNGVPVTLRGDLPPVGSIAPDFTLVKRDLKDVRLRDFAGKTVVLNIFPSIDTPVCAASVAKLNADIENKEGATVICVSADLPFALDRYCSSEGLENVVAASAFRSLDFGEKYGMRMEDGPLAGLLARALMVIDGRGKVVYSQVVDEISTEPDYEKALACLAYEEVMDACMTSFTAEHSRGFSDDGPCDDGRGGV